MFVTLIDTRYFVTLIRETQILYCQLPMTISGKKKEEIIGQSDFC